MEHRSTVTSEDIEAGLAEFGLGTGDRVMVHSSLRSFGWVEGGAEGVIEALQRLVGPGGTVLLPSFNHGAPFNERGEGIFDPLETPTTNGRIPDTFWRMPNVRRSLNPTHAFAAWGRDAERYTRGHHLTLSMGEDSPIGLLAQDGGYQLNLGTTHASTTAKHVAETIRRAPCLGYRAEMYAVRLPDSTVVQHRTWGWRDGGCPLTGGDPLEAEMERLSLQRKRDIGDCTVTCFRVADFLRAALDMLDNGYGGSPPCRECPVRPRVCPTTVPSDWSEEQLRRAKWDPRER